MQQHQQELEAPKRHLKVKDKLRAESNEFGII
jgi:hypothetical protein